MKKITAWILAAILLLSLGAAGSAANAERVRVRPGAEPSLQENETQAAEPAEIAADEDAEASPAVYAAVTGGSGARTSRPAPAAAPAVQTGQVPVGYETPQGFIRMTHQNWIRNDDHDYQIMSATLMGSLTLFLSGVTEEEKDEVIQRIEEALMFDQQGKLSGVAFSKIEMPAIADAEKYTMTDYDAELCWAATAANMLWQAGYAQQAINPYTGRAFASTDEVFDYFRHKFTDIGSYADGAIDAFLDGEYKYWNEIYFSQVKEGEKLRALCPDLGVDLSKCKVSIGGSNKDNIALLDNFMENSYGIGVGWWYIDPEDGKAKRAGGHDMTVCGVVIDENETAPEKKYKAILLADSDNDKIKHPPVTAYASERTKAAIAATYPDSITLYELHYDYSQDLGQSYGKCWWFEYDSENIAYIEDLYVLPMLK